MITIIDYLHHSQFVCNLPMIVVKMMRPRDRDVNITITRSRSCTRGIYGDYRNFLIEGSDRRHHKLLVRIWFIYQVTGH